MVSDQWFQTNVFLNISLKHFLNHVSMQVLQAEVKLQAVRTEAAARAAASEVKELQADLGVANAKVI